MDRMIEAHLRGQVERLKKRWAKEEGDRAFAATLSRIALGDWRSMVPRMPSEPSWHQQQDAKPKPAPNLLGFALSEIANLYDEEPTRALVDDSDAERAWWTSACWEFGEGLSGSMDRADALARLHGTALLQTIYRHSETATRDLRAALVAAGDEIMWEALGVTPDNEPGDGTAQDGIEVAVHDRTRFVLLANELDGRSVEAVAVRMGSVTRTGAHGKGESVDRHAYWDRRHFALLEGWEPVALTEAGEAFVEHGLADHPFVVARNAEGASDSPYGQNWGGPDLVGNLIDLAGILSEYGWTAKLQRGQPWARGDTSKLVLAPDAIVEVASDGSFGVEDNKANLQGMREAVMTLLEIISRTMGLPSRTFKLEQSGMSGIAIALDRAVLDRQRRQREKLARGWERAIHRKAADLYETSAGAAHTLLAGVSYRPLPVFTTLAERLQILQLERDSGLISRLDMLRELHPDRSDDALRAQLGRADEEREELQREADEQADRDAERQAKVAAAGTPAPEPDPLAALLGGV